MSIVIKRKPLTLMEKLYLPEIARGLSTTFRKLWEKPVTLEYPEPVSYTHLTLPTTPNV